MPAPGCPTWSTHHPQGIADVKTGLKKKLKDLLKKAMEDMIPISDIATTLVAPNGFEEDATW